MENMNPHIFEVLSYLRVRTGAVHAMDTSVVVITFDYERLQRLSTGDAIGFSIAVPLILLESHSRLMEKGEVGEIQHDAAPDHSRFSEGVISLLCNRPMYLSEAQVRARIEALGKTRHLDEALAEIRDHVCDDNCKSGHLKKESLAPDRTRFGPDPGLN